MAGLDLVRDDPRGDLLGLTTLTGLSTSQLISLLVAVSALIAFVIRLRRSKGLAKDDRIATPTTARA